MNNNTNISKSYDDKIMYKSPNNNNTINNNNNNKNNTTTDLIKNTSLSKDNITFTYPPYLTLTEQVRPNLILDLNGILIYSSHLIDNKDIQKYTNLKNFLLIYKDFDMNMFIIYYRNYIKEFLLELNNYYDIYIYSTLNRTQTDIFISTINHLIGTNVFRGIYLKINTNSKKNLDIINQNEKHTVIIDLYADNWDNFDTNIIIIQPFRGPHDNNYDKNNDLLIIKKCLLRIHKLFVDNLYNDIRNYIHDCVLSI